MSKKKEKLHLDASTEIKNKAERDAINFEIYGKYVGRFYDLFIGKRKEIEIENHIKYFEADSPFGPGKIIISGFGGWYDQTSNEMGSMEDFLIKMFPNLTMQEAIKGVLVEYYEHVFPDSKKNKRMEDEMSLKVFLLGQKFLMVKYLLHRGIRPK